MLAGVEGDIVLVQADLTKRIDQANATYHRTRVKIDAWRCACASLPRAAFSIRIAAANIALTTIRKSCRPMACVHR